jgi:hypothetical protein
MSLLHTVYLCRWVLAALAVIVVAGLVAMNFGDTGTERDS